jgi:hypothetical protein
MPATIKWSLSVQVVGGPAISLSDVLTVEAYDKVNVTVGAGTQKKVEVQPGAAGQVQFLLISSDRYNDLDPAHDLTYKVDTTSVTLDAPQLLVGSGLVELLPAAPGELEFTNGLDEDAAIEILVGRDATP